MAAIILATPICTGQLTYNTEIAFFAHPSMLYAYIEQVLVCMYVCMYVCILYVIHYAVLKESLLYFWDQLRQPRVHL